MKRIELTNSAKLKEDYIKVFDDWYHKNQSQWNEFRTQEDGLKIFPENLFDILIAEPSDSVKWYYQYTNESICVEGQERIKQIFRYKGQNQSIIAKFFMDHSEEMGISTCHYCDTAYINIYHMGKKLRSHFDIDHFLPKSKCPVLSLSLFNLIPSCPVCNERLKREGVLGKIPEETLMLNPYHKEYAFDEEVKIHVIPTEAYHSIRYQDFPDKYKIQFKTESEVYQEELDTFKLNERYDFHKCEALRLLDIMQDYPDTHIEMISFYISLMRKFVRIS